MKGQKTGEPAESLKPGHNSGNLLSNGGPKTFFFIDSCAFQSTLNYLHVQKLIMSDEIKECHCMICSLNLVGFLWNILTNTQRLNCILREGLVSEDTGGLSMGNSNENLLSKELIAVKLPTLFPGSLILTPGALKWETLGTRLSNYHRKKMWSNR